MNSPNSNISETGSYYWARSGDNSLSERLEFATLSGMNVITELGKIYNVTDSNSLGYTIAEVNKIVSNYYKCASIQCTP